MIKRKWYFDEDNVIDILRSIKLNENNEYPVLNLVVLKMNTCKMVFG